MEWKMRTRLSSPRRGRMRLASVLGMVTALMALSTSASWSDHAATQGHPSPFIDPFGIAPGSGQGGTPIRIYGIGLANTTSVRFGGDCANLGVAAPDFEVIDDRLLTATAPQGSGDVPVTVITQQGCHSTATALAQGQRQGLFHYGEPTITVTPANGLTDHQCVSVSVAGMRPSTGLVVAQASPNATFIEPKDWGVGPNPAVSLLAFPTTDSGGSWQSDSNCDASQPPDDVKVLKGSSFSLANDTGAKCPPTQEQADVGLLRCSIAATHYGERPVGTPITFDSDNPVRPTPMLTLSTLAADAFQPGATVDVAGTKWTGSPVFGSSTDSTLDYSARPGETPVTIDVCRAEGDSATCTPAAGNARVSLTRYRVTYSLYYYVWRVTTASYEGATLEGSFTVPQEAAGCSPDTCFVRVRQYVFNPVPGLDPSFVEATASQAERVTCHGEPITLLGTNDDDKITGTSGPDVIYAGGGNDVIKGAAGDDVICGGAGDDKIQGTDGNDRLFGDAGNDELDGGSGADYLDGGANTDICRAGETIGAKKPDPNTYVECETIVQK